MKRQKTSWASLLLVMALLLQYVPTAALAVSSTDGGGTLTQTGVSDGMQVGQVVVNSGYDLASVRYVFADGTYQFAQLTETEQGYTYAFPEQSRPVTVEAEFFSTTVWDGAVDFSWYDSTQTEFYLSEPAQLAGLAALVNGCTDMSTPDYRVKGDLSQLVNVRMDDYALTGAGGGNQSDTVYQATAATDFMGKTVYLTSDLDMGGVYDSVTESWAGPNWTPIGGRYSMEPETGEYLIEAFFNGVLDGQGHTVYNLFCDRYTAKGYAYSQGVGFVGYLGDLYELGADGVSAHTCPEGWIPTVRNLVVNGSIYGRRMVGGIVGRVGAIGNVVIENCANYADVRNTDAKGVGGICGAGWGTGTIRGCYNVGSVTTTYSCPAGGICGSNSGMSIYNCYNAGMVDSNGNFRGRGIGCHNGGSYTIDNSFFLTDHYDDPNNPGYYRGTALNISVNVTECTAEELQSEALLNRLNANGEVFVQDDEGKNSGYPVLYFETRDFENETLHTVTLSETQGGEFFADCTVQVPHGTAVRLTNQPDGGWRFNHYTANGELIYGDFFLVLEDVELGAVFSELKAGTLQLQDGAQHTVSLRRTGTVVTDGQAQTVQDVQALSGDKLYENDKLTASALLKDGAQPEDITQEYTGDFTFFYTYADGTATETDRGTHTVTSSVADRTLTLSAVPLTQDKLWTTLADTGWYSREQTVYTLTTARELAGLAVLVNSGVNFSGVTVRLGCDISLRNVDGTGAIRYWRPIGVSETAAFSGIFDGQGYAVTDMTVDIEGSYGALFGYCVDAEVRSIAVYGVSCSRGGTAGLVGYSRGGVISGCESHVQVNGRSSNCAGIAASIREGTHVLNCINYGEITGTVGVGGVVGTSMVLEDTISSCANYGPVTGTGTASGGVGGIVGRTGGIVEGCANYGEVTGNGWYVGGLVGHTSSADTTDRRVSVIRNSCNLAPVSSTSVSTNAAVGGLVGYAQYLTMGNCYNVGAVTAADGFATDWCGSLSGKFYRSVYNSISDTSVLDGACAAVMDVDYAALSYVSLSVLTKEQMAGNDFLARLNTVAGSALFMMGEYPEPTAFAVNQICTVTFEGDYIDSEQTPMGGRVQLPQAPEGCVYTFAADGAPFTGDCVLQDITVQVTKAPAEYQAVFMAQGVVLGTATFHMGDKQIDEPMLTVPEGYSSAEWPAYTLEASDLVIHAVYTRDTVYGDSTLSGGTVFLAQGATGVLTIPAGAVVTLDGSDVSAAVQLVLEKGASLTMRDLTSTYDGPVLVCKGDNTLTIQGECRLVGASTTHDRGDATIQIAGGCQVNGWGSLAVTAQSGNPCIQLADGAVMDQTGAVLMLYKASTLGSTGGVLNGHNATVRMAGGTLAVYSNSDNLYAVYVDALEQSGGLALFYCDDNEQSLHANRISLTGGSLKTQGRSHEDPNVYYHDMDAIDCASFRAAYSHRTVELTGAGRVEVDGVLWYQGAVWMPELGQEDFELLLDSALSLYLPIGGHTVSVSERSTPGYTAAILGESVQFAFDSAHDPTWTVVVMARDTDGNVLAVGTTRAAGQCAVELSLTGADSVDIFVLRSMGSLVPVCEPTTITVEK